MNHDDRPYRIALTGGPGGGKTTAADLLRREIGARVVIVPETATLLFSGGFPRTRDPGATQTTQRAVFHTQRALEDVHAHMYPDRILLCDRGTPDGAAYWPEDADQGFFESLSTSLEAELARYHAVIFFETAAAGDILIEGGNRIRTESNEEALALDRRLQAIWGAHPTYRFIPHTESFFEKLTRSHDALRSLLNANNLL